MPPKRPLRVCLNSRPISVKSVAISNHPTSKRGQRRGGLHSLIHGFGPNSGPHSVPAGRSLCPLHIRHAGGTLASRRLTVIAEIGKALAISATVQPAW